MWVDNAFAANNLELNDEITVLIAGKRQQLSWGYGKVGVRLCSTRQRDFLLRDLWRCFSPMGRP